MEQKFSDEKLLELRQAGFSNEEIALFLSKPEYAPTDEELEALMATEAVSNALDDLPEDLDEFSKKFQAEFGEIVEDKTLSEQEKSEKIKQKAAANPKLAKQIASLYFLNEYTSAEDEVEE